MKCDRRGGRRQSCSLLEDAVVADETKDCRGRPTIDVVEWTALSLKIGVRGRCPPRRRKKLDRRGGGQESDKNE